MKIIQIIVTAALLIFLTMSNVTIAHASEKNNTSKRGELPVLTSDAGNAG